MALQQWPSANCFPARSGSSIGSVAADIGLIFWFVFSLFPIFWMVMLALKNAEQQTTTYFSVQSHAGRTSPPCCPTRAPR